MYKKNVDKITNNSQALNSPFSQISGMAGIDYQVT